MMLIFGCFPTFRMISLPSSSAVISLLPSLVTFEGEGKKGFETSGSFHPTIQCHLPTTSLWGLQISFHYKFCEFWVLIKRSMCCTVHSLTLRRAIYDHKVCHPRRVYNQLGCVYTCLTQLYGGRDMYSLLHKDQLHVSALLIGHLQVDKWKLKSLIKQLY